MRFRDWILGVSVAALLAVAPVCAQDAPDPMSVPPAIRMPTGEEIGQAVSAAAAGNAAYARGDIAEAEPLLRNALVILEGTLGPDHPITLEIAQTLAGNLAIQGDPDGALLLLKRVAPGFESFYGPDHKLTVQTRRTLAFALSQGQDRVLARSILLDLLAAERARAGHMPGDSIDTLFQLAQVDSFAGEYEAALGWLVEAETASASVGLQDDPETQSTLLARRASIYSELGRLEEAEAGYRRALELSAGYSDEGISILTNLDDRWALAEILEKRNRPDQAMEVYRGMAERLQARAGVDRGRRREMEIYRGVFRGIVRDAWEMGQID